MVASSEVFFESFDKLKYLNDGAQTDRRVQRKGGCRLVILRGFRRGFLGQGPKRVSHLELLGRQAGACLHLHLHLYPLR